MAYEIVTNFRVHKMLCFSQIADGLLASQAGLHSILLVS